MSETALAAIVTIIVFGAASQWLAWRVGLPSILLLLLAGFVAGPVTGLLDTDLLLGDLLFPIVSLSVALILYEGGLSLRFSELSGVGGVARNLMSIGALLTWVVAALGAYLLFDLGWALSALLGAILVVTGPTVILPLLRQIRPSGAVGHILKWEGIVIDPVGALLAVLVFEALLSGGAKAATAHVLVAVLKTIVVGGGLGLLSAGLLVVLLRRYWVPDFLQNAVSLMFVSAAFVAANHVQHESGLLAVTLMGIALANQKYADIRHIVEFKENLRVLLISALFILLAARLEVTDLTSVALPGALFVGLLIVVARPVTVWASTWRSTLSRKERTFLLCMAPRGIVAAAVASVFALRLEEVGYEQAGLLVPVTFTVIVGTVAVYGLAAPVAARRLGVADPNPQGILFVGAHGWVRALAQTLNDKGYRVLLVDTNRDHAAVARMAGLPTYTGSILAEYALDEIDLGGIGRLFAVTPNEWVNVLAIQRVTRLFGHAECYQLPPDTESSGKRSLHKHLQGRLLFDDQMNAAALEERFAAGATIKATPLSDEFGYADFRNLYGPDAVPMMVIDSNSRITVVSAKTPPDPQPGQTLIALVREQAAVAEQ